MRARIVTQLGGHGWEASVRGWLNGAGEGWRIGALRRFGEVVEVNIPHHVERAEISG
jgi:hypothetical protein